ncbi:hypothetical protein NFI95_05995 [Acetobacteraceae bacterium KSS8]|uniref:Uncharacterized protein n=1 Tax=Endosaccharibacter trunci TaxID=2812733 RepID=A0ABT1W775_9PROT|nr:hypothetical protein [Acetobacteraceae bacterium KSS8]
MFGIFAAILRYLTETATARESHALPGVAAGVIMLKILQQTGEKQTLPHCGIFSPAAAHHRRAKIGRLGANMTSLSNDELTTIRDAVPHLDLSSIRALRRAGFDIVRATPEAPIRTSWTTIPRPMRTSSLVDLAAD